MIRPFATFLVLNGLQLPHVHTDLSPCDASHQYICTDALRVCMRDREEFCTVTYLRITSVEAHFEANLIKASKLLLNYLSIETRTHWSSLSNALNVQQCIARGSRSGESSPLARVRHLVPQGELPPWLHVLIAKLLVSAIKLQTPTNLLCACLT